MSTFFSRERFGQPQVIAGVLLVVFLGQCVWLVSRDLGAVDLDERFRIEAGLAQWRGLIHKSTAAPARLDEIQPGSEHSERDARFDHYHSRLYYLIASAPMLAWPGAWQQDSQAYWRWLARAPYLWFGVMLGASLWYVARRLYGNAGGYMALTLYCFAPGIVRSSALWNAQPEMGAAWGIFGAVFTAIAVAHTLYAPREVVLWNWRRILLLGVSVSLAVGSQFSTIVVLPAILCIMLYVAPERRKAAWVIWLAGCLVACLLLLAAYGFRWSEFAESLRSAEFLGFTWQALRMRGAYLQWLAELGQNCPALVLAFPAALIAYASWKRARYFGNTAPLLIAILFLVLGLLSPHYPGMGFRIMAVPFLFLFVAGVFADLLETRHRSLVQACVWGLLGAYSVWSLLELARVRG